MSHVGVCGSSALVVWLFKLLLAHVCIEHAGKGKRDLCSALPTLLVRHRTSRVLKAGDGRGGSFELGASERVCVGVGV